MSLEINSCKLHKTVDLASNSANYGQSITTKGMRNISVENNLEAWCMKCHFSLYSQKFFN